MAISIHSCLRKFDAIFLSPNGSGALPSDELVTVWGPAPPGR